MAKPRELYNTPAPQAMTMMGAGIADAYANAGRIEGQGMAAMGQGIAQGITSAVGSLVGAYAGQKQAQAQAKSYEGFLKNPLGQKMLGINAGTADGYIAAAKSMGGAAEQNQFYQMGIPGMMQQNSKMQQIQAANPVKPAPSYPTITFEDSPLSNPTPSPAPSGGMTVGSGLGSGAISPQTASDSDVDYANFLRKKGWGGGPIKQAWVDEYNSLNQAPYLIRR
jgi:hypothetical protein